MRQEKIAALREQLRKACHLYLIELLRMWGLEDRGHWVADCQIYDYGGAWTLGMDDIIFCVEKAVRIDVMFDWIDYVCWATDFQFDVPTLTEWCNGCKRADAATRKKLSDMSEELHALCAEERKKLKEA